MTINAQTLRHITITVDNYNKLKSLGQAGDSFNDVITTLLEINNSKQVAKNSIDHVRDFR